MNIKKAKEVLGKEFSMMADFANETVQDLRLQKDAKILDVGTGTGTMAIVLALNGYNVLTGEPETDGSAYAKQDWLGNARKVGVDRLIEFRNFMAENMPFEDYAFDAVFMLGSLHHIDEYDRVKVLRECFRTSKQGSVICIFEPNQAGTEMIKNMHPTHPDTADPNKYTMGLNLIMTKKNGEIFDAFIFRKAVSD